MDKNALKTKVETSITERMIDRRFKNVIIPIPKSERFDIREYEEGTEKTAVMAYGKDDNEFGIYTKTNFIPIKDLSYRELEKVLNVIHE